MKRCFLMQIMIFILVGNLLNGQTLSKAKLDNFIDSLIRQNSIPGLSIAVVYGDSIIYAEGFGVKKIGESDSINEHTLYEAMSLTKSFTATIIGTLVDEGRIKWTDPVINYIPGFKTSEPYITQTLTIQDLLTLRSGLMDGDTLSGQNRKDLIPKIQNLKISNSFRLTQSSYNLNYALVGLIEESVLEKSWEDIVKIRILTPLEMNETFTDLPTALCYKNVTLPHITEKGEVLSINWSDYSLYRPAEGIYSNVLDLAKWAQFQYSSGVINNKPIIKPETLDYIQQPQTIALDFFREFFNPEANFMTLSHGWFVSDYKGYKLVQMGGLSYGTTNLISIIPSEKIGIIIQSNKGFVFDTFVKINYKIFEDFFR